MSAPNNPTPVPTRRASQQFLRLFSVESSRSSTSPTVTFYQQDYPPPQWNHSFTSIDFLLKILQLIVAVICTGLYSKGILIMDHSITTIMFPNVVFSAFIIITSVIAISYILGHVMHDILVRIFNSLATILYFVSAAITGHFWFIAGQYLAEESQEKKLQANMLFAETCLAFLNAFLYGYDVFASVKRTLKNLETGIKEEKC